MAPAPRTDLRRRLRESREDTHGLVAVVGSGLNVQATRLAGGDSPEDWNGLLNQIAHEVGMSRTETAVHPTSLLATWEGLVVRWAEFHDLEPYVAEGQLQTRVVRGLRQLEDAARNHILYRELIDAACGDIVSLNFDRRLALAAEKEVFDAGPKECPEGPSARTLYRHSQLFVNGERRTRVWYPHGDTRRADTLKLGVRRYGFHLGLIREYFGGVDSEWRDANWHHGAGGDDFQFDDDEKREPRPSWVDVFLTRPLVFVGCGLSSDEWSLWWLLQLRAARPAPQPVFFTFAGHLEECVKRLARVRGITPVEFRSHDGLWDFMRNALAR